MNTLRRLHQRRIALDAYFVLSLRSPVSVVTDRSAGNLNNLCSTEDSWGEQLFY